MKVRPMARALVWTHGLQDFTVAAAPAWAAVTFSVDAHTVVRTAGVQTVSWGKEQRAISRLNPGDAIHSTRRIKNEIPTSFIETGWILKYIPSNFKTLFLKNAKCYAIKH